MAKRRQQSGEGWPRRIQRDQQRESVASDRPDRMVPEKGDKTQRQNTTEDIDDAEPERKT
jgi:hypothetical protein